MSRIGCWAKAQPTKRYCSNDLAGSQGRAAVSRHRGVGLRPTKIKIASSFLTLFIGCAPLPHPSPADINSLHKTRSGVPIVHTNTDLSHLRWWQKMHDPALNTLMQAALERNNQLHTAQANILQAQAQLKEARFAWLPTLDAKGNGFIGGGWDTSFSPEGALARSSALTKLGRLRFHGTFAGFVPTYSLNILANIHQNKFAKASLAMQQATYHSTRLSIISQVAGAYFMLLGQKEQRLEQRQLIHDLRSLRHLEKVRFKDGASDLSTLLSLDQQIANNEASLASLDNSIAQVENSLQLLVNRNPGAITTTQTLYKLPTHHLIPAHLSSTVLQTRPDLLIAEENLKMSESNLGLAYANFFPAISLTGLLGRASLELHDILKLNTTLWVAEGLASLPLLNGANYEAIAAAKAAYYATYYTYLQTVKSVFQDVDNSLTNQQKMRAIYEQQYRALQASRKAYDLAVARYHAGAKDHRDVVNAQIAVDNAKLTLTLAKMQHLDSLVEVYQSLAGGYLS